jgi:RNA polymerase sigma factor (sigma-70 family)
MSSTDRVFPIDQLLAQREWVRGVARALVFGEQEAADLEQDAWLAALRKPPRHGASIRGWLGTVVRRIAARKGGRESRRRDLERREPRKLQAPSAAELVAQAEMQTRVARGVLSLAEPYRETILLRFFQDYSIEEIAEAVGAPIETVRSRLKRGLAILRKEMNEGDASGWRVLLLPVAPLTAAKAASLTGGLIVASKTKALALVAIASLVAAGVWFAIDRWPGRGEDDLPPAQSVPGWQAAASSALPASAPASEPTKKIRPAPFVERTGDEASSSMPAAASQPAEPVARVVGEVLSVDGLPVENALVFVGDPADDSVLGDEISIRNDREDLEIRARPGGKVLGSKTKADGRFAFDLPKPSARLTVGASHPDHGLALALGLPVQRGEARVVTLRFEPGIRLRGTVASDEGRVLSGARVTVMRSRDGNTFTTYGFAETKADGKYDTGMMQGIAFSLRASAKGHFDGRSWAKDVGPDERERRVDFRLEAAPVLKGRLVLADGSPAAVSSNLAKIFGKAGPPPDQRLELLAALDDPRSDPNFRSLGHDEGRVTESDDSYEFTPKYKGAKYLSLWSGATMLGLAAIPPGAKAPDIVVDWSKAAAGKRAGALTLTVKAADTGRPVDDYRVQVKCAQPVSNPFEVFSLGQRVNAADGRVRLDGLPEGAYRISIKAEGFADGRANVDVKPEPEVADVSVDLVAASKSEARASIAGFVRGPGGSPRGGANVWLVPDAPDEPQRTTSNADGAFKFDRLMPASYVVVAEPAGLAAGWARATPSPVVENLVVECVEGIQVLISPEGGSQGPFSARMIDSSGVAVFDDFRSGTRRWASQFVITLAPGRYTLELTSPNFDSARVEFVAAPGVHLKPTLTRAGK